MMYRFTNQFTARLLASVTVLGAHIWPLLVVALLLTSPRTALSQNQVSYSFAKLQTLGDKTPSGLFHINDYEPGGLNNNADATYGTDLGTSPNPATNFGEGAFLRLAKGVELELALANGSAPGGGTFSTGLGILSPAAINDLGNAAFGFALSPPGSPIGVNSGVYRYSQDTGKVTAVVVPGVTPAPAGGTFKGVGFGASLNNRDDLVFSGIVATDKGVHLPGETYVGLGVGVFKADAGGRITSIVSPGDPAPGGGLFDFAGTSGAGGAVINQGGDIALVAHVAGEESKFPGFPPQAELISALGSLYLKDAGTGNITSIAHLGNAAPGGGVFREIISPALNDFGELAFIGDISPFPNVNQHLAVYLYSGGVTRAVALPGDSMPGGGHFVTTGFSTSINNSGKVVFAADLDTDLNMDGVPDTGLYVWSHGAVQLVARTGTVIPGVGTIGQVATGTSIIPPPPSYFPASGPINDHGQILFGATLSDGTTGVLLLATPSDFPFTDDYPTSLFLSFFN